MSLVSIVIPAFNQGRFVSQAIESALGQTYAWIDVVVVNDGSTDETADVLDTYADRANVTVVHQANEGLPAARNRGLREARGEFVCFLDSDDYLSPDYVSRLLAPLEADASVAFTYCDVHLVDESGAPANDFSVGAARRVVSGDIFESLLIGGYFPPHTVLVRRSAIEEHGAFDTALGGHADYELWLRLSASGAPAYYVDERLAFYRVYDGSMSRDRAHMRSTRVGALERISRAFPERTAAGLSAVQDLTEDLHAANSWLKAQWDDTIARIEADRRRERWSLIEHFADLVSTSGAPEQLALWDVVTEEAADRCVFLHPPASAKVTLPTGAAGRLSAAVSMHPDTWTQPSAKGCVFTVTVDDTIVGVVMLDPVRREADRRWVCIELDVPVKVSGAHTLVLETAHIGRGGDYGWALFKDVTFVADA